MSSIYVLRQPHISTGTPMLWLRENGTICPFGVFPCVEAIFCRILRPIPVMRAIMVLLVFPLFCRHFGCLWVLPKLTVSFSTPIMALSTLQKHYVLKENAQLWREKYYKTWENVSRMHFPIYSYFPSFLCSGNPHNLKKSPGLPCASLELELRNRLIQICGPPTPQNTQQMLVCDWCGREFCVIPLCNRLCGMSLHISENYFPFFFLCVLIFLL